MRRWIIRLLTPFIGWKREGDSTMEEKQSTVSGVIRCFCFREKRGRGSACFERGKEHVRRLLVPSWRGN
jgi:hypothetical protein